MEYSLEDKALTILNSSNMKNDNKIEFNNLVLKSPSLSSLFNQFNNIPQTYDHKDPGNVVRCKCYDLEEVQSMKISDKNSCLSLFHIHTCSLNKNFEDLEYLIKSTNINFDIIAISETRMLKDTNIVKNINIPMSLLQLNQQQEQGRSHWGCQAGHADNFWTIQRGFSFFVTT